MVTACPHCAAPAINSAEPVDAAGRMLRCARCGTKWLSRIKADERRDQYFFSAPRKPTRPRFERVIDHVAAEFSGRASKPAEKPAVSTKSKIPPSGWHVSQIANSALTAWSGVAAAVAAIIITFVAFDPSVVGASPDESGKQFAGLDVHLVTSAAESIRDGRAVDVRGEITNTTSDEIAVPAVRLSLHSKGTELHSWIVEPIVAQLAGGGAVRFRSMTVAPSSKYDEVLYTLTERRETATIAR